MFSVNILVFIINVSCFSDCSAWVGVIVWNKRKSGNVYSDYSMNNIRDINCAH